MAIRISTSYRNQLVSPLPLAETAEFFTDFERSLVPNFRGLERFEKQDGDRYHWVFQKLSYGGYDLRIEFATRFDRTPDRIAVVSLPGYATRLAGGWEFAPRGEGTEVRMGFDVSGELPLPFFLSGVVSPIAQKELTKIFDEYHRNVQVALAT